MLLKKEAIGLADNLADSVFTTLADSLADSWRINRQFAENPVFMRVSRGFGLADKLADNWRGAIRQSATPFRVADRGGCWRIQPKNFTRRATTKQPSNQARTIAMTISQKSPEGLYARNA